MVKKPKVDIQDLDSRVLIYMSKGDPAYFTAEVAEDLQVERIDAYKALMRLYRRGLVRSKAIHGGDTQRIWWRCA